MLANKIRLLKKLGCEVFVGVELEFYSNLPKSHFKFKDIIVKDEIGNGQIETVFPHSSDIFFVLRDVINFRNKFCKIADFRALPDESKPPSALQFNVSILQNGKNILNNAMILFVMENAKENMSYFAPTENCKKRLSHIEGIKQFRNSPYTFSIGSKENRTVAIRLKDGYFEHRIPSPLCMILKSFNTVLEGIIKGINSSEYEIKILHSNAFESDIIKAFSLCVIKDSF